MKIYRSAILLLIIPIFASCSYRFYSAECDYPVPPGLHKIRLLDDDLHETSGLARSDSTFYTLNDSGAGPELFEFTERSETIRKTVIANATNSDWEAIAFDGDHFFVGDVGNNFGTRDTLVIYKIDAEAIRMKESLVHGTERITFSYNEEVSRNAGGWYSHDCEAIFAFGDSIYLFSKDWVGRTTRVYALPKVPGHYNIRHRNQYMVDALITGSDVDAEHKKVALVGYRNYVPILIVYTFDEDPAVIKCGGKARKYPMKIGTQVEAACFGNQGAIYITAEKQLHKQALYKTY